MFAPPPKINKVTINSMNCKKLIEFYSELGMLFHTEEKDNNKKLHRYIYSDLIFEICEVNKEEETTKNASLRFLIDEIDGYINGLKKMGIRIVKDSWESENHQHILLNDPEGNLIELMTKNSKINQ